MMHWEQMERLGIRSAEAQQMPMLRASRQVRSKLEIAAAGGARHKCNSLSLKPVLDV